MSSPEANALAALHLARATIRTLAKQAFLTSDEARETIDTAIKECKSAGPTLWAYKEAAEVMAHIRDADFGP